MVKCLVIGSGLRESRIYLIPENETDLKEVSFAMNYCQINKDFLHSIKDSIDFEIDSVAICVSILDTGFTHKEAESLIFSVWPKARYIWVNNHIEAILHCIPETWRLRSVIDLGLDAQCFAMDDEVVHHMAGFGQAIGDRYSGNDIVRNFLHGILSAHDRDESDTNANSVLQHLDVKNIRGLIRWSMKANADDKHYLLDHIFALWQRGHPTATKVIENSMDALIDDYLELIKKFNIEKEEQNEMNIYLCLKGMSTQYKDFTSMLIWRLGILLPRAEVFIFRNETIENRKRKSNGARVHFGDLDTSSPAENEIIPNTNGISPTMKTNKKATKLEQMSPKEIIELFCVEDDHICGRLAKEKSRLEYLIHRAVHTFRNGGRLFYIATGSAGNLAQMDTTIALNTFKCHKSMIQALVAPSLEEKDNEASGEDSMDNGIEAVKEKDLTDRDMVIGITSSGQSAFVWGALYESLRRQAFTCLLTFNHKLNFTIEPDLVLAINLGPEIILGNTWHKCGTATKSLLNIISTTSLVKYCRSESTGPPSPISTPPSNTVNNGLSRRVQEKAIKIMKNVINDDHTRNDKRKALRLII